MSHRGEYRSIHTVLVDSPEFLDLSPEAQLIFFHLKLRLGPSGIGVLYPQMLEAAMPSESLSKGIRELCGGDHKAWLYVERNVFWLRNALRYDPSISLNHDKHRAGVLNHLGSLPKLKIGNDFARYYDLPFPFPDLEEDPGRPKGSAEAFQRDSQGSPLKEDGGRRGERKRETENEDRPETATDEPSPHSHGLERSAARSAPGVRMRESGTKNPEAEVGAGMGGNELLARWIAFTGVEISRADRGKQGAAAKRIARSRSREQIVAAMVGMTQLYPHSNGEPWDIFDLERKFAKAQAAAKKHPELRATERRLALAQALEVLPEIELGGGR